MENRKAEIANIVTGFTASVMNLVSHYRGKRAALNQVPQFVAAVEHERARLETKFASLLGNPDYASLAHEIHDAQHQVNQIADGEKARALESKTVEFDTTPAAVSRAAAGLSDVVGKLEKREFKNG